MIIPPRIKILDKIITGSLFDHYGKKFLICDISFFGLVNEAIGIGLGIYLLQTAILTAWDSRKIKKLTVNTCSLDHKSAIYLYQKYGFTPVKYKDLEKIV